MERTLFAAGGATEAKQDDILARLSDVLSELQQKLEAGEEVALDAATVAALSSIVVAGSVSIDNFPTFFSLPVEQLATLDPADLKALLAAIRDRTPALSAGRVPVTIEDGQINVSASFTSFSSALNSRDTPLAANETFVGEWEDVRDYSAISVMIRTSHASAAPNGAQVQFTDDPLVGPQVIHATFIPANMGVHYSFAPEGRYVRFVYTNGSEATTSTRSEVTFHFNAPGSPQAPLAYANTDANSAVSTKAHLAARHSSGQWVSLAAEPDGSLRITGTVETGSLTNAELRAADVDVADSGEREYTHVVATVTAVGDTVVYTPAAGKAVRLRWIYAINDPTATTAPLIRVSLGGQEIYRAWALSKRQRVTGPVDGDLVINLSGVANVAVTAVLEEV